MEDTEKNPEETYGSKDAVILSYSQNPVVYKNIPKVWLTHPESTEENPVLVPFTYGEAVKKEVELSFAGDFMKVTIPDGELVTQLTILRPETLLPENIAKDIVVAGVRGTHEGGGLTDAPQMFAPSSAYKYTSGDKKTYLQIYDNGDNGKFPRKIQVLLEDGSVVLAESELKTTSSYTDFYGYSFSVRPSTMPFKVCVQIVGEKFLPSNRLSISASLFLVEILRAFTNCDLSQDYRFLFSGDSITLNLAPHTGYYYPKALLIEPSEGEIVYAYDPLTGSITIPAMPEIDHIRLSAEAPNMPWLRNPVLGYDSMAFTVEFLDDNAESTPVICDGETLFELVDGRTGYMSHEVNNEGSYGFVLQSDGYYKENSSGSYYRVALCKVTLNMKTAGTVTFSIVNYGYSSYDYGIVGKVDKVLSTYYNSDIDTSSANVYTTYKSNNSTSVKTLSMSVPAGEHFIYFKYRRYQNNSTSYYFKFKVTSVPGSPSKYAIADYVEDYGEYNLTVQSIAEGYTPSDPFQYVYVNAPIISVSDGTLSIENLNSSVTQVLVVLDYEHLVTLDHDGSGTISLDLSQYTISIAKHTIYADAILDTGETCRSNILEDEPLFVYSSFSTASWEEISQVAQAGLARKCYKTTDTKVLTYNGSMSITVAPAGFNHDDKADGSGKAGLSIISINVPAETVSTFPTSATMLSKLPADLRTLVCPILKEVDSNYTVGDLSTKLETCSVFVPSITELGLTLNDVASSTTNSNYLSELGECYEKYATTKCSNLKSNSSGTNVNWLTRNRWHGGSDIRVYGSTGSQFNFATPSGKSYAFGFCLG